MIGGKKEDKTRKDRRKPDGRGGGNRPFYLFFLIFFGGYLIFFTSPFWMMDMGGAARQKTELHEEILWNDREVSLLRWDYAPEQGAMEIELSVTNRRFDGVNAYSYDALERSGKRLTVEKVIEEPDWVILQIKDVPKRFAEISLRMEMPEDESAGMIRLYTNRDAVRRVGSIQKKSRDNYMVSRLQEEIEGYEAQIATCRDAIQEEEEGIQNMEAEIKRLESELDFQTEEEKANTGQLIKEASGRIEDAREAIAGYEEQIGEYEERIQNVREKESLMKGRQE